VAGGRGAGLIARAVGGLAVLLLDAAQRIGEVERA
jgi:hypothetical protein